MSLSETGLCSVCVHARKIPAEKMSYYFCDLSKENSKFRKYPALPVLRCEGFKPFQSKYSKFLSIFFFMFILASAVCAKTQTIVFLGDSLTAGYGLSEDQAYPSLIQKSLECDGLDWKVTNAGISGDTTSGGSKRVNWILKSSPTIVFVALGANDGLRGIDPDLTLKNLESIVTKIKKSGALVILAGMQLPVNYGTDYRDKFKAIFPGLARKHQLSFYPFLLERVAAKPELNLADGIHPNESGQIILAQKIYSFLKPLLVKIQ